MITISSCHLMKSRSLFFFRFIDRFLRISNTMLAISNGFWSKLFFFFSFSFLFVLLLLQNNQYTSEFWLLYKLVRKKQEKVTVACYASKKNRKRGRRGGEFSINKSCRSLFFYLLPIFCFFLSFLFFLIIIIFFFFFFVLFIFVLFVLFIFVLFVLFVFVLFVFFFFFSSLLLLSSMWSTAWGSSVHYLSMTQQQRQDFRRLFRASSIRSN